MESEKAVERGRKLCKEEKPEDDKCGNVLVLKMLMMDESPLAVQQESEGAQRERRENLNTEAVLVLHSTFPLILLHLLQFIERGKIESVLDSMERICDSSKKREQHFLCFLGKYFESEHAI